MKLFDKLVVWIRLQQLKADKTIRDSVVKSIQEMKTEERLECSHPVMLEVGEKGGLMYQCKKCKRVFMLVLAPSWDGEGFEAFKNSLSEIKVGKNGKRRTKASI